MKLAKEKAITHGLAVLKQSFSSRTTINISFIFASSIHDSLKVNDLGSSVQLAAEDINMMRYVIVCFDYLSASCESTNTPLTL